jgi:hypothetical protein
MESARLLEDIAQQIQALTIAQEQTARRVRSAIAVGVTAVITSIAALIVALAWSSAAMAKRLTARYVR